MKKQITIRAMAIVALLLTIRVQAQIVTFNNSLPCRVVVTLLEIRSGTPGTCGPGFCGNQVENIPPNSTGTTVDVGLICGGSGPFNDMCIEVTKVGNCPINTGVHLTNSCHGPVLLDSAPMSPTCCNGAPIWTATWAPGPLVFNIF